jgi:hypothetical protein
MPLRVRNLPVSSGMDRSSRIEIWRSAGAPCRTARLASRSHGPTGKLELPESFTPHVHAELLGEGEGKAGNAVAEHGTVYAKFIFIEQQAGRLLDFRQIVPAECFAGTEFADPIKSGAVKFGCDDDKIH